MPRGGKRSGSGRKAFKISAEEYEKFVEEVHKREKEEKKTVWQVFLDFVFLPHKYPHLRLAAAKEIASHMLTKKSQKLQEEHKYEHRVVELPKIKRPKEDEIAQA